MMFKMLAITAMSFGLATAALAQTTGDSTGSGGQSDKSGQTWDAPINDTFYSDTNGTLRSEAEVRERWSKLSPTQQDKVRNDCKSVDASNAAMAGACNMIKMM